MARCVQTPSAIEGHLGRNGQGTPGYSNEKLAILGRNVCRPYFPPIPHAAMAQNTS